MPCQPCYYRPQPSCEGYVFTGVCLSTGGVVSASVHAGIPHPPPQSRYPPGADTPWERTPRGRHPPQSRNPPGADTPGSRHPPEIRSLLRTVRILLECILVYMVECGQTFTFARQNTGSKRSVLDFGPISQTTE